MTAPKPADVAANVGSVRERIGRASRRAGRDPAGVTLVAAAKTVPVDELAAAVEAGITDVGENRAQELLEHAPGLARLGLSPRWHFIGALQRNKVRQLAPWVTCWQSIDREPLAIEVARRAPRNHALVEVNLAGEPTKTGCSPADVSRFVERCRALGLEIDGLMAIPPAADEPRRWFSMLRDLAAGSGVAELSMGMTHDFEVAIEEGATIVRVGRAIFGPRRP